jgi:hypothetical protein
LLQGRDVDKISQLFVDEGKVAGFKDSTFGVQAAISASCLHHVVRKGFVHPNRVIGIACAVALWRCMSHNTTQDSTPLAQRVLFIDAVQKMADSGMGSETIADADPEGEFIEIADAVSEFLMCRHTPTMTAAEERVRAQDLHMAALALVAAAQGDAPPQPKAKTPRWQVVVAQLGNGLDRGLKITDGPVETVLSDTPGCEEISKLKALIAELEGTAKISAENHKQLMAAADAKLAATNAELEKAKAKILAAADASSLAELKATIAQLEATNAQLTEDNKKLEAAAAAAAGASATGKLRDTIALLDATRLSAGKLRAANARLRAANTRLAAANLEFAEAALVQDERKRKTRRSAEPDAQ